MSLTKITSKHAQKELIRKQLREVGNEFLKVVKEEVDSCVLLCDIERLDRLVRELCDKAGRITKDEGL